MNLRTNVRSLCEEAFFLLSSDLDKEQAEKISIKLIKSNLNSIKKTYQERLETNNNLINCINKKEGDYIDSVYYKGSMSMLKTINKSLKEQIKEIDDKLYDLQILENE